MKLCVFFFFKACPWIVKVGDWALRWTEGNETLQIVFVMLLFPVIMNALQYYIVDSFIKNKEASPVGHEAVPTEDPDNDEENEHLDVARETSFESDIDTTKRRNPVAVELKVSPSGSVRRPRPKDDDEAPSGSAERSPLNPGSEL